MEKIPDITISATESVKKEWCKPLLEIISKEIIQGGSVAGVEGHTTPTHSGAISQFS